MKNLFQKILASKYGWLLLLVGLFLVNFLASSYHTRFDLTKEKRYTLSKATKDLLTNLTAPVEIEVFLEGDFPAGFRKLANSTREFLANCKEYAGPYLQVKFTDPFKQANDSAEAFIKATQAEIARDSMAILMDTSGSMQSRFRLALLRSKDPNIRKQVQESYSYYFIDSISAVYSLNPFTLQAPSKVGDEQAEKTVLPGAVIHYEGKTAGVNLLKGTKSYGTSPEDLARLYNDVEATLEYKFGSAIQKITTRERPVVAYALGHGEGWGYNVDDAVRTLATNYRFDTINIRSARAIPSAISAVVILKPTLPFSDEDKLKIDQYVMNGGKVFWMIDNMYAEFDSLYKSGGFTAFDRGLNLDDILFRYGVRINPNLLQDMQCDQLPQVSGQPGGQQQQRLVDWPFFPVLNGTNHPISKNLGGVRALFPNTIDTVQAAGVKKTFLLKSSANARVLAAPAIINFEFMQIAPDVKMFNVHDTSVAVLLEGKFTSLFRNRISKTQMDSLASRGRPFREYADEGAKMIVVADGDIATNQFSQASGPLPMGTNVFTRYTFANKEFYTNCLEYLVNPSNILETRAKDFTLRLLDPVKIKAQKSTWQFVNIGLPVVLVLIFGLLYQQVRKGKYAA
jgi:gliding-associated putative ABC transporter substrate-binding component GldG